MSRGVGLDEFVDDELRKNALDVANVPLLVEFGGEDLPVGVTKRMAEPVELRIELSKCASAKTKQNDDESDEEIDL